MCVMGAWNKPTRGANPVRCLFTVRFTGMLRCCSPNVDNPFFVMLCCFVGAVTNSTRVPTCPVTDINRHNSRCTSVWAEAHRHQKKKTVGVFFCPQNFRRYLAEHLHGLHHQTSGLLPLSHGVLVVLLGRERAGLPTAIACQGRSVPACTTLFPNIL